MRQSWMLASRVALAVLLPAAVAAGCSDYLTTPRAIENPNNPTQATVSQLVTGTETNLEILYTGDLARSLSLWTKQYAGLDRQFVALEKFDYGEDNFDGAWSTIYTGGGLIDLRAIESRADASGDATTAGIARVMEAMYLGLAADLWGDVPLTSALKPGVAATLTPQAEVYAAVQAKLDTAISLLGQNKGPGPGSADLYYGGNTGRWSRAAHSLKARYYLHVSNYARALAEAKLGFTSPADDMRAFSSENTNEQNLWYQFTEIQRSGYIGPNAYFVNLLQSQNDPRLTQYFSAGPGSSTIFGVTNNSPKSGAATLNPDTRGSPAFRQPIITYAEVQLILAEAALRGGDAATALAAYNAERTSQGVPTATSVTLNDILTEKYIINFQNIEAYNDYRRTCLPAIPTTVAGTPIPGRLLYPDIERKANPNIPPPSQQPAKVPSFANVSCPIVGP